MSTYFLYGTLWLTMFTVVTIADDTEPDCRTRCGDLTIPYPFGIGQSCSLSSSYLLECDMSYNPPRAFTKQLNSSLTGFRVFNISETQIILNGMVAYDCSSSNATINNITSSKIVKFLPPSNSPFILSNMTNKFLTAGSCDYDASYSTPDNPYTDRNCRNSCFNKTKGEFRPGTCAIINGCCHQPITSSAKTEVSLIIKYDKQKKSDFHTTCGYLIFGLLHSFTFQKFSDYSDPGFIERTEDNVQMAVDYVVGNQTCKEAEQDGATYICQQNTNCTDGPTGGYNCICRDGYEGNPYQPPGCINKDVCKDGNNTCHKNADCIDGLGDYYECKCRSGYHGDGLKCEQKSVIPLYLGLSLGGVFSLLVAGSGIYILIQKRRLAKTRRRFFKQNGGLMLKEKLESSNRGGSYNSFRLFTFEELKRATKNFSKDLIIGVGGYGIVYKGTLRDDSLAAIKVSKSVDNTQIEQFITETIILTQLHHRNVVKVLGCCLEAEIPILVYEFIANGSLLEHIYDGSKWLTWNNRLRIATEIATALGYLHSAASTPVIHRDIKSANILLGQNHVAKISDFGASRLIPMDKTQMSTLVQGTLGYMDPEYLINSQLTDKSDVYSFGVVVAELLTGEKALSTERSMKDRNLAKYFVSSFTEGRLLDIIDPRIVDEAPQEQLVSVAKIVQQCLRRKTVDRPRMKDVAIQLAGILKSATEMSDDHSTEEHGDNYSTAEYSFSIEAR